MYKFRYTKTNSLRIAPTTALEKGAEVVGELILTARLSVAENMQMKSRVSFVVFKQEEKKEKQSTLHTWIADVIANKLSQ